MFWPEIISRRSAQIGPAIDMDSLARDVPRARAAQEAYRGGDLGRRNAVARQRVVRRMVLRLGPGARRADEARNHEVDGDLVVGEILREPAREADQAGLGGDDVQAVARAAMAAQAAEIDDRAGAALLEMRQAGFHAQERAVERDA